MRELWLSDEKRPDVYIDNISNERIWLCINGKYYRTEEQKKEIDINDYIIKSVHVMPNITILYLDETN